MESRQMNILSLKIIKCDFYLSYLTNKDKINDFRKEPIPHEPIIRVFGSVIGQPNTCCVHIFGYYPYLTILWKDPIDLATLQNLAYNIDEKLNTKRQSVPHIINVLPFKAKSIYGYNHEQQFLRIFFCNPNDMKKIADLLVMGEIYGKVFQPYEAHIPFDLKFFIDHNLFGMNILTVKNAKKMDNLKDSSYCKEEVYIDVNDILKNQHLTLDYPGLVDIIKDDEIIRNFFNIPSYSQSQPKIPSCVKPLASEKLGIEILNNLLSKDESPSSVSKRWQQDQDIFKTFANNSNCTNLDNSLHKIDALDFEDLDYNVSLHGSERYEEILEDYLADDYFDEFKVDDESHDRQQNLTNDSFYQIDGKFDRPKNHNKCKEVGGDLANRKIKKKIVTIRKSKKPPSLQITNKGSHIKRYYPVITDACTIVSSSCLEASSASSSIMTQSQEDKDGDQDSKLSTSQNIISSQQSNGCSKCGSSQNSYFSSTTMNSSSGGPGNEDKKRVIIRTQGKGGNLVLIDEHLKNVKKSKKDFRSVGSGEANRIRYNNTISTETDKDGKEALALSTTTTTSITLIKPKSLPSSTNDEIELTLVKRREKINFTYTDECCQNGSFIRDEQKHVYPDTVKPVKAISALADFQDGPGPFTKGRRQPNLFHNLFASTKDHLSPVVLSEGGNNDRQVVIIKPLKMPPNIPFHVPAATSFSLNDKEDLEDKSQMYHPPDLPSFPDVLYHDDFNLLNNSLVNLPKASDAAKGDLDLSGCLTNTDYPSSCSTNPFSCFERNLSKKPELLRVLVCEVFASTRGDLLPNPQFDSIHVIAYSFYVAAEEDVPPDGREPTSSNEPSPLPEKLLKQGCFYVGRQSNDCGDTSKTQPKFVTTSIKCDELNEYPSELKMMVEFQKFLRAIDPDIIVGFETEKDSWGYLCKRAARLGLCCQRNVWQFLSRVRLKTDVVVDEATSRPHGVVVPVEVPTAPDVPPLSVVPRAGGGDDLHLQLQQDIVGRIPINLWRLVRKITSLNVYTFENVVYHVLGYRVPRFSHKTLTTWYHASSGGDIHHSSTNNNGDGHAATAPVAVSRSRVFDYYLQRVLLVQRILRKLDVLEQTSEFARLYGVEFGDVLRRGSQYKVESMMLRLANRAGYVATSPSPLQRQQMSMSQMIPLVLEPEAGLYNDPVIVLDFQSLYPSIIIAYNLCFTTCLGYLSKWRRSMNTTTTPSPDHEMFRFKFGCTELTLCTDEIRSLQALGDSIFVSPVGVGFVSAEVRRGILPSMLAQILETRIRIKLTLKKLKNLVNATAASDTSLTNSKMSGKLKRLIQLLDTRQMALKLISNVTFGYTSAYFSGRMPCVEIADSILGKAREILQTSIDYINNRKYEGDKKVRVIYGDTDSIFVLVKDSTRKEAFDIGYVLASEITQLFRQPIELKFEKVYQPCVLQSKKRYVGFSYESPDQEHPKYDAKGIETVRRDFCAAVPKILEKTIRILFTTGKIDSVRSYLLDVFNLVSQGKVSLQDYVICKEYRGRTGYKPTACVPALEIAKRLTMFDPMAEPMVKERVPYIIITPDQQSLLANTRKRKTPLAASCSAQIPLISLVLTPAEFLKRTRSSDTFTASGTTLNADYYIRKQIIPPVNRILNLLGFDAIKWYETMPKSLRIDHLRDTTDILSLPHSATILNTATGALNRNICGGNVITNFFRSAHCIVCRGLITKPPSSRPFETNHVSLLSPTRRRRNEILCESCAGPELDAASYYLYEKNVRKWTSRHDSLSRLCRSCTACYFNAPSPHVPCVSFDCPVFYHLVESSARISQLGQIKNFDDFF